MSELKSVYDDLMMIPAKLWEDRGKIVVFGVTNAALAWILPMITKPLGGESSNTPARVVVGALASGVVDDAKFIVNEMLK